MYVHTVHAYTCMHCRWVIHFPHPWTLLLSITESTLMTRTSTLPSTPVSCTCNYRHYCLYVYIHLFADIYFLSLSPFFLFSFTLFCVFSSLFPSIFFSFSFFPPFFFSLSLSFSSFYFFLAFIFFLFSLPLSLSLFLSSYFCLSPTHSHSLSLSPFSFSSLPLFTFLPPSLPSFLPPMHYI